MARGDHSVCDQGAYMPSEEEIAAAKARFRARDLAKKLAQDPPDNRPSMRDENRIRPFHRRRQ